jgi:hypothetical protein
MLLVKLPLKFVVKSEYYGVELFGLVPFFINAVHKNSSEYVTAACAKTNDLKRIIEFCIEIMILLIIRYL